MQQKRELTDFIASGWRASSRAMASHPTSCARWTRALDPKAMTIGFARRFATYKRADLIFRDEERLARLLSDPGKPVQIVIAGKAHPADRPGQRVIQRIFELSRSDRLRSRVFIVEDYDIRIARFLVAGVDVWLNNPRRPLEASGTSGMKAAHERRAQRQHPGRLVGRGLQRRTTAGRSASASRSPTRSAQDEADAEALYRLLEDEIVPRFFDRDDEDLPVAWLATMRAAVGRRRSGSSAPRAC